MKKSVYNSAMSRVKTSENFKEVTFRKLMHEMEKTTQTSEITPKEPVRMEFTKKKKVAGWTVGVAACVLLSVTTMSFNAPTSTQPDQAQPTAAVSKPPTTGKMAVNIDGVITEVSADGKSFKVGDLWVTVTPDTIMGIDGPTAAKPSEELLQKQFKVGNTVSGFTSEDISTGKVNATRIYNNMAPQK